MTQTITAIYEQGHLYPMVPLDLEELQKVNIKIIKAKPTDITNQQILKELIAAGIVAPPRSPAPEPPLSDAEREILSRELGKEIIKPLSEVIIEERG